MDVARFLLTDTENMERYDGTFRLHNDDVLTVFNAQSTMLVILLLMPMLMLMLIYPYNCAYASISILFVYRSHRPKKQQQQQEKSFQEILFFCVYSFRKTQMSLGIHKHAKEMKMRSEMLL